MGSSDTSPQYQIVNLGTSTLITITPHKNLDDFIQSGIRAVLWFIGELAFFVIFYYTVGGFLAKTLGVDLPWFSASSDGSIDTFLSALAFVWLVVWTISGLKNSRNFLWQLAGKENIEVSQLGIKWRRTYFDVGKIKHYHAAEIADLRLLEESERKKKQPIAGSNMLAFDYEFSTVEFGGGLTDEEARAVLTAIVKNFRQYAPGG